MNLTMLERVKDDGADRCKNDSGLKGVEWAYGTTPSGKLGEKPTPVPSFPPWFKPDSTPRPLSPEDRLVDEEMQRLAGEAPRLFISDADKGDLAPGDLAYVCADGVVVGSAKFRFVP